MNWNQQLSKHTKVVISLIATLAPTIAITTPVRADDYAVGYPGSVCQARYPSHASRLDRLVDITNIDETNYAFVTCPIERRYPTDNTNTDDAYLAAVTVDKTSTEKLGCAILTANGSGSTLFSIYGDTTSTGINTIFTGYAKKKGTYSLFCYLPPKSSILNFVIYRY